MENSLNQKKKVRVVALDFDGVITNLTINWNNAKRLASRIAGYEVKSLLAFYEVSFGKPIFQTVSMEVEKLELQAVKEAQPSPFVGDFIHRLVENQIVIYVVTMQSMLVIEEFLSQHDLRGYFQGIVTRETCPSREAQIRYILQKTGFTPGETLLVDDSERNLTRCRELGIECFRFERNPIPHEARQMWNSILKMTKTHII